MISPLFQFDTLHLIFYSCFHIILNIAVLFYIILNKEEEPSHSALWILLVWTVPVLGVILFLFFGVNRKNTLGLKISKASKHTSEKKEEENSIGKHFRSQNEFIPKNYIPDNPDFEKMLSRQLEETVPLTGNSIKLLKNGTAAYPEMLKAIEEAQSSINLQSFIIVADKIGYKLFHALKKKADEGVEIRVLYDKFGSFKALFKHFFKKYTQYKNENIKIRAFARTNIFAPWRVQLRNHRKLLVVDGKKAFMGGINISDDNDIRTCNKAKYIHDLHCEIKGPAVSELQYSFLSDWHFSTRSPIKEVFHEKYFPKPQKHGETVSRILTSGPGQIDEATECIFHSAAASAKSQIMIITPYFVPDKPFIQTLKNASARGVEIKIIVPQNNNHWFVKYASSSLYETLLLNGIRIFEKKGAFSHAKAMMVDGQIGVMGSSNCDVRSFRLNYELDLIATEGKFINDLHSQFSEELKASTEIKLNDVLNKKIRTKFAENFCSLFSSVL